MGRGRGRRNRRKVKERGDDNGVVIQFPSTSARPRAQTDEDEATIHAALDSLYAQTDSVVTDVVKVELQLGVSRHHLIRAAKSDREYDLVERGVLEVARRDIGLKTRRKFRDAVEAVRFNVYMQTSEGQARLAKLNAEKEEVPDEAVPESQGGGGGEDQGSGEA